MEEVVENKSEKGEMKEPESDSFNKVSNFIEVETEQGIELNSGEGETKEAFNNNFIGMDKGLLSEKEWNEKLELVLNKYVPAIKGWGKWSRKSLNREKKKGIWKSEFKESNLNIKRGMINIKKISFHKVLEKIFFPYPLFFPMNMKMHFFNLIKNGDKSINEEFKKDFIYKYKKNLLKGGIVEKKGD